MQSQARITAIGSYVPQRVLTNAHLEKLVDTSDEWIMTRTGIAERRIAGDNEFTSDLIRHAVEDMVERYDVDLQDVDYIIVATSTPDTIFPSMAAGVQAQFGIPSCGAVDIQAACAGFAAGLQLANGLLLSGSHKKIVVIGADALSKITDYSDRTTCILFGDGAGAVLLETISDEKGDLMAAYSQTDGKGGNHLYLNNIGTSILGQEVNGSDYLVQNGKEVFRWALSEVSEGVRKLLLRGGLDPEHIDWFLPHSANRRIIDAICERTGISQEQVLTTIRTNGNTSAASIPLSLHEGVKDHRVAAGQTLLLYGFGGGLTQAGVILRWSL
ncbi:ketoacyl-ACP synthase III [Paenibacillus sp. HB172176]|uniref:ketoacyl-ACP synthase III n=1 Tax=Paenibacillus sp. HB172176 TaxID=2493690 RepID=UPI0014387BFE|nr:ketoacyl-ACP synthase III [Paenibacillus sp. HB172176]